MPNRLIKQIIAKLNGESTQEAFDIYDDAAVHTDKIADNLTTNDASYVLSAKQGKVLKDYVTNSDVTGISFTESSNISSVTASIGRTGILCPIKISFTYSGSTNSEKAIGTLTGVYRSAIGLVINRSTSKAVGTFQFTSGASGTGTIYMNVSETGNMALSFIGFAEM